jgi:hypothetical protein
VSDAGLTLTELFADLASNGLRLVSCTMNGAYVASFTTTPVEKLYVPPPLTGKGESELEKSGDPPDALEQFLARKEKRDQ